MIPSLLLLSASVVASPVIVSEVKATREAGHLRVEVRGDGGIDPEAARTRIDQGSLFLFLGGTRVRADNRAWKLDEGVGEIRAHRHHTETELDVPLTGNGCTGPVELEGTPTGLTALVGCDGPAAATPHGAARIAVAQAKPTTVEKPVATEKVTAAPAPLPVREAAPASVAALTPPAKPAVKAAESSPAAPAAAETTALKNLVALPASDDEGATDEKAVAAKDDTKNETKAVGKTDDTTDGKKDDTKVVAAAAAPARVQIKADLSATKASPPPIDLPLPAAEAPAKTASVAPSGLRAVGLPALFLAGLAVAAYLFARKKRSLGSRRIEILETASLGPKRSLVIARVGDETLVLGTSEAGITLLQTGEGGLAAARPVAAKRSGAAPVDALDAAPDAAPEQGPSEMDQSLIDALADVPEPDGVPTPARGSFRSIEGGLASLFGRKAAATAVARVEPKFDDLLEDSVEDQELRRKLAAGMSARVR